MIGTTKAKEQIILTATGHDSRIDLKWEPAAGSVSQGYNIYRSTSAEGTFEKLNSSPHQIMIYSDFFGQNNQTYYYYVTSLTDKESKPSKIVSAGSYQMNDGQLLTSIQEAAFRYFWDYAHPVSGLTREGYQFGHEDDCCTSGGTGMGLMAICIGAERGFISRKKAAQRIVKMLTFLDKQTTRHHGAWPHWFNGATGQTIAFAENSNDDGGDLVETAYVAQGLLTVRQYFDNRYDSIETNVRSIATSLWETIEWDWYRRLEDTDGKHLYWHWSPNYGWHMNMPIVGYNECMITYLLAIASPTHPIPASCYYDGWAGSDYANGETFYGHKQFVSLDYGGPLFFTHYSNLGFDPRQWSDKFCNYFDSSRNISLINRDYCIENPKNFAGYSDLVWGLTASWDPWGYDAHSPTNDNGTITPTAAISAMPYVPIESIATLKHFYHTYGAKGLWGPFGFTDSFNLKEDWFAKGYVAIDQGPILIMIENYRSGLCWDLFMANPEIKWMMADIKKAENKNSAD